MENFHDVCYKVSDNGFALKFVDVGWSCCVYSMAMVEVVIW